MKIDVDFIPKPGDTVKHKFPSGKDMTYIWTICPNCGKGRWVSLYSARRPGYTGRCKDCAIKMVKAEGFTHF